MKNAFEYEAELTALREENERLKSESFEELYNAVIDERDALIARLKVGQVAPKFSKCVECNGLGSLCMAGLNAHPDNWEDCGKCGGTGKETNL